MRGELKGKEKRKLRRGRKRAVKKTKGNGEWGGTFELDDSKRERDVL